MADASITPSAFVSETMETARTGSVVALIGVAGAAMALLALAPFFAPASLPMSVVGIVLGRRSRDALAMALGALGLVLAITALIESGVFWLAFATVFGGLAAG